MINFEQARGSAFAIVQNTRTVERVSEEIKNKTSGTTTTEYWRVIVEVPMENRIREFTLEVSLDADFPLSLPAIKLCASDYEATKHLPHLDTEGAICLYDQESAKQDTSNPAGIVNECINQAVRILSDGLNKDRVGEFNDEINAYWENTYHKEDMVVAAYLGSNMAILSPGVVEAQYLVEPHGNINLYIGNQEDETKRLLGFFKLRGHTVKNLDAFYLGEITYFVPPFYCNNKSLLKFIKSYFNGIWNEIKAYLNRNKTAKKFLLFSVVSGDKPMFFGFYLYPFPVQQKGWRADQSTVNVMNSIHPTTAVTRVRFTEFHPQRLQARTDGREFFAPAKKVMLAGLGSIGSHLLFYLNALDISKYVLVDPDVLGVENINRHLLTFNEVGLKKVDAIEKYIKYNNPFIEVKKHPGSIVELVHDRLSLINEVDLIFCAIGKDAIETYILQHLSAGDIEKPVLMLWVEPYLLGAHVLYILPGTTFALKDLEVDGFYKFNLLAKETYQDPNKKLSLREAGCQSSYMPYGKNEILRFFSALNPHLFDLIETPPDKNLALTYAGDLSIATALNFKLSSFANTLTSRQITIQHI